MSGGNSSRSAGRPWRASCVLERAHLNEIIVWAASSPFFACLIPFAEFLGAGAVTPAGFASGGSNVRGVSSFATLIAVLLVAFAAKYERAIVSAANNAPALVTAAAASMPEPSE